jgi:ABC-type phosphate transport system substrate-binding protein
MLNLMRRPRRIATWGLLTGALVVVMALAVPAGAQTTTPANNIIVGSGSSSTYNMMQGLDTLFNDALGCYMTQPSGTTQTLNFSCASNNEGNQVGESYTENPINDVATEEPALGSSAGIEQLESQGTGSDGASPANPSAPVNYARSSRLYNSGDDPGLNFVAYATDAVSWFTFPKVNGKASASSGFPSADMTKNDLIDIWNGTYTKWNEIPYPDGSLPGPDSSTQSICPYVAQSSSGTDSTWATFLDFSSAGTLNAAYVGTNPTKTELPNCKVPSGETYSQSHTIFENEGKSIVQNGDEGNAIFLFSWGKYGILCGVPEKDRSLLCADGKGSSYTTQLGEINGITADSTTIYCDTEACEAPFPCIRFLYNVYSDGSFTPADNAEYGFPVATNATLNYVSEIGFICKSQLDAKGNEVDDPNTGLWYHTEISDVIDASGFLPLPYQSSGESATGVAIAHPAATILSDNDPSGTYLYNDPVVNAGTAANAAETNPDGYCIVWTTDGNATP